MEFFIDDSNSDLELKDSDSALGTKDSDSDAKDSDGVDSITTLVITLIVSG